MAWFVIVLGIISVAAILGTTGYACWQCLKWDANMADERKDENLVYDEEKKVIASEVRGTVVRLAFDMLEKAFADDTVHVGKVLVYKHRFPHVEVHMPSVMVEMECDKWNSKRKQWIGELAVTAYLPEAMAMDKFDKIFTKVTHAFFLELEDKLDDPCPPDKSNLFDAVDGVEYMKWEPQYDGKTGAMQTTVWRVWVNTGPNFSMV